jgi:hypothetical protein
LECFCLSHLLLLGYKYLLLNHSKATNLSSNFCSFTWILFNHLKYKYWSIGSESAFIQMNVTLTNDLYSDQLLYEFLSYRGLNSRPPDWEAGMLTTRPRLLPMWFRIIFVTHQKKHATHKCVATPWLRTKVVAIINHISWLIFKPERRMNFF